MPIEININPATINKNSALISIDSITDEKFGNIISIDDIESIKINGVQINIEPIQGDIKE